MLKVTRQPAVRRVSTARFQHPIQFGFQLSDSDPQAMLGDLAALMALSQRQARLEQLLYGSWEGPRPWRSDLCHLAAALQQMGQATLMERELESVVGRPAVVHKKSIILGAQNRYRLLISPSWQNGVYGHLRTHRHVQPLKSATYLPAGFVHAVHGSLSRSFDQSVIGGLGAAGHPRPCPVQPSTAGLQPVATGQDLPRVPQRQPHLLVQDRR